MQTVREHGSFPHQSEMLINIQITSAPGKLLGNQFDLVPVFRQVSVHIHVRMFAREAAQENDIRVGLGTDVGGGTSLSVLRTASEAYKVLHLQDQALPPFSALYLATLGAARALYLDDNIGNFEPGKEADFVVLDSKAASITSRRLSTSDDVAEKLFAFIMLGDDRSVAATYLMGKRVHSVE